MALVLVDSAQTRKKFVRDYEKAMRDLKAVQAEMREYEAHDKPQFLRWMHREFGALLTEMRELNSKLRTQEELLFRIQNLSLFEGVSPKKAYEHVMREQAEAEREQKEAQEERQSGKERDQDQNQRDGPRNDPGDEEDPFTKFFSGNDDDFFPSHARKPTKVEQERLARLKEIYRIVVRKLHPDTQKEMTQHKRDLWHQAQEAYEKEDADQLEVILALCEIEEQSSAQLTRLSVLQRITAAFKRSLKPLKSELKKLQKDPAWGFTGKQGPELKEFSHRMRLDLERERRMLREELANIETELAQIKSSRRRKSRVMIDPLDIFFSGL